MTERETALEVDDPSARRRGLRALTAASSASMTGALPVFMVAGLVVFVRADLGLSEAQFGVAVSLFFATAALTSAPVGRLAERLGGASTLAAGATVSALALVTIAAATGQGHLYAALIVAGLGHVLSQLGANLRLSEAVPASFQGIAFAIRQSGAPAASLLAGASVPWIGVTLGWRQAVAAAALLPVIVVALEVVGRGPRRPARRRARAQLTSTRQLVLFAVATALATAPLTALAAFVVDHAVHLGLRASDGGLVLAGASAAAIVTRLCVGRLVDRTALDPLRAAAGLLLVGSGGFLALSVVDGVAGLVMAAVVAYGAGWGWTGAFILGVVRANRQAPAAATGIPQIGMFAGGAVGPTVFGGLVVASGYALAWLVTGLFMAAGAVLLAVAIGRPGTGDDLAAQRAGEAGDGDVT